MLSGLRAWPLKTYGMLIRALRSVRALLPHKWGGEWWLYSPGQTALIQKLVVASFPETTPGFPGSLSLGHAYVRPKFTRRAVLRSPEFAVLIPKIGHLGNTLLTLGNALGLSQVGSTGIIFYAIRGQNRNYHRPIESFQLPVSDGLRGSGFEAYPLTKGPGTSPASVEALARVNILWKSAGMQGADLLIPPDSPPFVSLAEQLARRTGARPQTVIGETRVLTVHLRAGDLFGAHPHPRYGQPPWVFYETVLQSQKWARVVVVAEDSGNPVLEQILRWCRTHGVPISQRGADFVDAIEAVAEARIIVLSNSTFVAACAIMFPRTRKIYHFGNGAPTPWFSSQDKIAQVVDSTGFYEDLIFNGKWRNQEWQRKLMVEYRRKMSMSLLL